MINQTELIAIYNHYKDELYFYIMKLVNHRDTAEDILHDCFVRFIDYNSSHNLDINSDKIKPFLYTIAHNLCVNHLARNAKINFINYEELNISNTFLPDYFENITFDELINKINSIINTIDPELRSIFIMHKELGMRHTDIAKNLHISERTVRRKIKKVLKDIMHILKNEGYL